ncbi:lactonase family protein [Parafilimonas terrae]|jgi:6-phosphogluconolactonase|uniref:6-phosphogluconolactonase, cycloisomerase 2 family n=1 Tax=Parafilimonas terrae TaxID=1465490 RepID=A0A1I5SE25_9BACT|nr:lactonase family protein [Parafilimonas terrae]SFP69000.1 6-phosphogluconolactonase, cycloisomerase 2 family [Parafilimonas terrae]
MKKIFLILITAFAMLNLNAQNPIQYLFVGTYTDGGANDGIYVYKFNPNKGEATLVSKTSGVQNPSWICVTKDGKFVYAVNENGGDKPGELSAFAFDKKSGQLTFLNKQPTDGYAPCYVSVDASGKNVITANYAGGNITVFKTNEDGSLQPHVQLVGHEGYGVNVTRQEMPHPHQVIFSPDGKFVFSPDLGTDRVYQYNFNGADAKDVLTPANDPGYVTVDDGLGPRHIVFSPDGKTAYLINELAGNIIVYGYADGNFTPKQTIASTTAGDKNDRGSAEIAISPNGKFLYTSNRGAANDVALYKVQTDGTLLANGTQAVNANPRGMMVDPTGRFLLVASQNNNTVQIFVINKNFGLLQDTNVKIDVQKPVCLVMTPVN